MHSTLPTMTIRIVSILPVSCPAPSLPEGLFVGLYGPALEPWLHYTLLNLRYCIPSWFGLEVLTAITV